MAGRAAAISRRYPVENRRLAALYYHAVGAMYDPVARLNQATPDDAVDR